MANSQNKQNYGTEASQSICIAPASDDNICKVICKMKLGVAMGADEIPVLVLKKWDELSKVVVQLINKSLSTGVVPDQS